MGSHLTISTQHVSAMSSQNVHQSGRPSLMPLLQVLSLGDAQCVLKEEPEVKGQLKEGPRLGLQPFASGREAHHS